MSKNKPAPKLIPRAPQTFKLLPEETVLEDDYNVHPMYVYIVDGVFCRFGGWSVSTVGNWKKETGAKEIRRCQLFGHQHACLGDRIEL